MKQKSLTVLCLPTAPSAGSPCDPSESYPHPSSTSCQDTKIRGGLTVMSAVLQCVISNVPVCTCTSPVCPAVAFSAPLSSLWLAYER